MEQINVVATGPVFLASLERPFDFRCPVEGEYALLLVVERDGISPEEQAQLSTQFVRSGCRYAICFGPTSSSWDDSIDMVGVLDEVEGREAPFVMTTWRDEHPLAEAVWDFVHLTHYDDWTPAAHVAVLLGGSERRAAELKRLLIQGFNAPD